MSTPEKDIPRGRRVPHPAEAAAEDRDLTRAEINWQRVLEVVAWRAPYVDTYLRGSRIVFADRREVHYEVLGGVSAQVITSSPEADIIHEAVRDVTGRRLVPVPHTGAASLTAEERRGYAAALATSCRMLIDGFGAEVVSRGG